MHLYPFGKMETVALNVTEKVDTETFDDNDLYKNSETVKRIYIAVGVLFTVCVFHSNIIL